MPASIPQPKARRSHWLLASLLCLLLLPLSLAALLLALLLWLPLLLPYALQPLGIGLELEQPRWTTHSLQLERLALTTADAQLQASGLALDWHWQAQRPLQHLHIDQLQLQVPWQEQEDNPGDSFELPHWLANSLPQQLQLKHARIELPGLLTAEGSINIEASEPAPLWLPSRLELNAWLEPEQLPMLPGLPADDLPRRLQLSTQTSKTAPASGQPALQSLDVHLHSLDNQLLDLHGILHLHDSPEPALSLEQARLHLHTSSLRQGNLQLRELDTQLSFQLDADLRQARFHLLQPAQISARSLQPDTDIVLQQPRLELNNLELTADYHNGPVSLQLRSNYQARINRLQHAALHPQHWTAGGTLNYHSPDGLAASARINGQHGLQADSQWRWHNDLLTGEMTLTPLQLGAANPLQKSLVDWPALLNLDSGRLNAQASLSQRGNQPLLTQARFTASNLNGIVDRSELKQLSLQGNARLRGEQLQLDISQLSLASLDPGVPLTSINARSLSFKGHLERLSRGQVSWQQLDGQLLGGTFNLPGQSFRLNENPSIALRLHGIQLQEALRLYPTEGLDGQAIIDGSIPLRLGNEGLFVEAGQLQARQPGMLRFQSEQIHALGQSNPAMQLVAEALDDFHFSLLSSRMDYQPSGQLLLNIRLEGKNPAVENGRPIHLNLNLEENLPALLASIQLSNHVSETIQQRIRQRFQSP